jgi:nucleotide-binding universal stress UspA family protein
MILLKHVLVATDFSPPSEAALAYGRELARTFGASLHLLHIVENSFLRPTTSDPHAILATKTRTLNGLLTDADRRAHGGVRAVVEVSDFPAQAIAQYAKTEAMDLIVMGTHGRSTVSQILAGSVAERVVRIATCPVLTVRHPEHEFVLPDSLDERRGLDSPQDDSRRH